jgi:GNAT superfamily N-acetyltransferase
MTTYTETIIGKDLTEDRLRLMIPYWDHNGEKSLEHEYQEFYKNDIFFLVRSGEGNALLSMGRLRPITVTFMAKEYPILGISDIKSVIQGQGYGKILLQSMIEYLLKDARTAIGFCTPNNRQFYEKCGLGIIRDAVFRFIYQKDNQSVVNHEDEDVIYFEGQDRLISKIDANRSEKITFLFPHW